MFAYVARIVASPCYITAYKLRYISHYIYHPGLLYILICDQPFCHGRGVNEGNLPGGMIGCDSFLGQSLRGVLFATPSDLRGFRNLEGLRMGMPSCDRSRRPGLALRLRAPFRRAPLGGSGRSACQQHHQRAERQIGGICETALAAGPVGDRQDDRGRATR